MNNSDLRLLLTTNGEESTRAALNYGIWLAETLNLSCLLLGAVERPDRLEKVQSLLDETAERLEAKGVSSASLLQEGKVAPQIANQARTGKFITVVAPMGRPAWKRWIRGRVFRRLLAEIPTPLFYIPKVRLPLRKILVCMGGLGYAFSMEHMVLALARRTGANITLLNIIEPITLDYPISREVHEHADDLVDTNTPQGRNLREALDQARQANVPVEAKIRQGSVVQEILEEIRSGDYDLIGMGSPHSSTSLRHFFMPNVTAEVAETIDRPVFTVRTGYDIDFPGLE